MSITTIVLIAFGGALAIEGVFWAIFPRQLKDMYRQMMAMPERTLHQAGLVSVGAGVLLLMLGVKMGAL